MIVRYNRHVVFVCFNKVRTKVKLKYSFGKRFREQARIVKCYYCRIVANDITVFHYQLILQMDKFTGRSCFEIEHSDECRVLCNPTRFTRYNQGKGTYNDHTYHNIL